MSYCYIDPEGETQILNNKEFEKMFTPLSEHKTKKLLSSFKRAYKANRIIKCGGGAVEFVDTPSQKKQRKKNVEQS